MKWQSLWLDLLPNKGNFLYRACVVVFNKTCFERKVDTSYSFFVAGVKVKPEWRSQHKPPLSKRVGFTVENLSQDHSVNSCFKSSFFSEQPFCSQRVTVFHAMF